MYGATRDRRAGSSPHTRGAPVDYEYLTTYYEDHPRIRGEHRLETYLPVTVDGSSPHTRGALTNDAAWDQTKRIIPAYAGSTCGASRWCTRKRDHPRIRGEHPRVESWRRVQRGSSPHTRGALPPAPPRPRLRRIIPAYAGSTLPGDLQCDGGGDHPRIRGEHGPSCGV